MLYFDYAHKLLKEYIFLTPPIAKVARPTTQISNDNSASKKKWILPISIVSGVIIVIILFFAFGNGRSSTDDVNEIQLQAHHDKYVSLKSQADLLAKQKNWQEALFKYEEAYVLVEEREVKDSVESMMDHLFNAAKEKEAESKRIKIGDMHEGGIVFKIDAKGKHGLVCAPKDLGKYDWDEAEIACQNLTLNGYSDWYLPTKYELDSMYKIIGQGSSIGNVGGFTDGYYWSSTTVESDDFYPCRFNKNFTNGAKSQSSFYNDNYVRAVRLF